MTLTPPLLALLGYVAWALLLLLGIALTRIGKVLSGEKKSNEFPAGVQHGSDRYWRLNRAHLNTLENLPIVGALVLVGTVAHVQTETFNTLPLVALAGRVLQSISHVASGGVLAVNVRFAGFLVQFVCFGWLVVEILRATR